MIKKIFLSILAATFAISAFAIIRTVNNNPGAAAQYSSLSTAISQSNTGDTLLLSGSNTAYTLDANLIINIVIIGPGWAPESGSPTAKINTTASAWGFNSPCTIEGIEFVSNTVNLRANNQSFIRCLFSSVMMSFSSISQINFNGCHFVNCSINGNNNSSINNITFYNSVFRSISGNGNHIQGFGTIPSSASNIVFQHNLFYGNNALSIGFSGFKFVNNIVVNMDVNFIANNSIFQNNLFYHSGTTYFTFPWTNGNNNTVAGNITNQSPLLTDQSLVNSSSTNLLLDFTLQTGSPAFGNGIGGENIGLRFIANDGANNWSFARNSRLPFITTLNVSPFNVSAGGNLNVTGQAKSGN